MTITNNRIFITEAVDFEEWNEFAANQPEFLTVAHNPSLKKILEKSFGFKSTNYIIKNENEVVGIFPITQIQGKSVSLPHFSYGDLITTVDQFAKQEIRKEIIQEKFEIRSFESFADHIDNSKIMCYLNLKDSDEEQWGFWKSKLRSQIRKGFKNGITVKIGGNELLSDFYRIYSKNMRDLGSPVLSIEFFRNILSLFEYGEVKIFLAEKDGVVMASSIILTYHEFVEVCWASSLREYNKLNPNLVIYWEMIKFCINRDYKIFSFGRSSKDSSTLKFKRQWTPVEKQIYFNFPRPPKLNIKKYYFLAKLWSQLPLAITNRIGPHFSKNIY